MDMVVCFVRNLAVKLDGSKLYFSTSFHVRYDVHGVYVFISKFHAPKTMIWMNIIRGIVHDFGKEDVIRRCGRKW